MVTSLTSHTTPNTNESQKNIQDLSKHGVLICCSHRNHDVDCDVDCNVECNVDFDVDCDVNCNVSCDVDCDVIGEDGMGVSIIFS